MRQAPVVVSSASDGGSVLERIQARPSDQRDEGWLQSFLFAHPSVIPADHFDEPFVPLIPLGREVRTGAGHIDVLYASPLGRLTIIETKLWQNPEKHRAVVAQIIDYAKEVSRWSYDDLSEAVIGAARSHQGAPVRSLEDLVRDAVAEAGLEMTDFQESLIANMESGEFLLLIIGDRISPNLALLTESIRGSAGLDYRLGLVELQIYPLSSGNDWPVLVIPDVVGRTVEEVRGVIKVHYSEAKPEVTIEGGEETTDPGTPGQLSLDSFLDQTPEDLRVIYEQWVRSWRDRGFTVSVGSSFLSAKATIRDRSTAVVRGQRGWGVSLVRKKDADGWGASPEAYQRYLDAIGDVPRALDVLSMGKKWLKHTSLTTQDMDTVLEASTVLGEAVRDM